LLAYYTFESVDSPKDTLTNVSPAGSAMDARIEGAKWARGHLPGKYALHFRGRSANDKVILPQQERFKFTGPFSVAVWFRADYLEFGTQVLLIKGDESWRLLITMGMFLKDQLLELDTDHNPTGPGYNGVVHHPTRSGQLNITDHQWHHVAAVYEPIGAVAHKRVYVDGRLAAQNEAPLPMVQVDVPVVLGNCAEEMGHQLEGWIDEVAIFSRALSADEVAAMFDSGKEVNGKQP
jgi:hypothetical protein